MILLQVYDCCICINGILKPDFLGLADSFCSYDDSEENKFQANCGQGKRHYYYSNFKKLFYSCFFIFFSTQGTVVLRIEDVSFKMFSVT